VPGLEAADGGYGGEVAAAVIVAAGILLGALTLWLINEYVPHEHFILGHEGPASDSLRRIWLFVIAITLHNFPEGLAVGVGFGAGDFANGTVLAVGIGLQTCRRGWRSRWHSSASAIPRVRRCWWGC
jgi:ZIP family zinc transporter